MTDAPARGTPRLWLALVLPLVLGACYPINKTLQPDAEARVVGPKGEPLAPAQVTLISSAYPYGQERFRTTTVTDPAGVARFYAVKDLRVETLMIHGAQSFFWNWCVRGEGYRTVITHFGSSDGFDPTPLFQLEPGPSTPCPPPPGSVR